MSPTISRTKLNNCITPIRRTRTWFSQEQLNILENAFRLNTYPDVLQREDLAAQTQLSEAKIQVYIKKLFEKCFCFIFYNI